MKQNFPDGKGGLWRHAYDPLVVDVSSFVHRETFRALAMQRGWCAENLVFQGGACLRLVHESERFSEDLNFYLRMEPARMQRLLEQAAPVVADAVRLRFGAEVAWRARVKDRVLRLAFRIQAPDWRRKIVVCVDGYLPRAETTAYRFTIIHRAWMHVAAATRESLMGDKIVALAMRPYVKLRDFYDVWWLWHELGGRCDPAWVEASARLYGLTLQDVAQGLRGWIRRLRRWKRCKEICADGCRSTGGMHIPPPVCSRTFARA